MKSFPLIFSSHVTGFNGSDRYGVNQQHDLWGPGWLRDF